MKRILAFAITLLAAFPLTASAHVFLEISNYSKYEVKTQNIDVHPHSDVELVIYSGMDLTLQLGARQIKVVPEFTGKGELVQTTGNVDVFLDGKRVGKALFKQMPGYRTDVQHGSLTIFDVKGVNDAFGLLVHNSAAQKNPSNAVMGAVTTKGHHADEEMKLYLNRV